MKNIVVDKIASVAQHNDLTSVLRLSSDIPCEEGILIAVRVLNNKSRYNQLELISGRMATVTMGDVVVGALGHRHALRGYSGHLPTKLSIGDHVQLLNIGGVIGICESATLTSVQHLTAKYSVLSWNSLTWVSESVFQLVLEPPHSTSMHNWI